MKTQINIPDTLHTQARTYAAANKTTLRALINEGLAALLARKQAATGNPIKFRKEGK